MKMQQNRRWIGTILLFGLVAWPTLSFGTPSVPTGQGTVFNDLNGNRSSDGGTDPGLVGWQVDLFSSSNVLLSSATTDGSGLYTLSMPGPGGYIIKANVPGGWLGTSPVLGAYPVTVGSTDNLTGLDFGAFQLVSVSGFVYNDVNGDGFQGAGEPGLAGRAAQVLDSGNNVVSSAFSDVSGNYTVPNIGPGSFTLHVLPQAGETITQPTSPDYYSFTSSSGVNVVGGIFGLTNVPEPGTLGLIATGLLALPACRWRRK